MKTWPSFFFKARSLVAPLILSIVLSGCATTPCPKIAKTASRQFNFGTDTFAYANELVWDYGFDADGKWTSHAHKPKPEYTQHCFVVARSARQFFEHARFDPSLPVVADKTYSKLIDKVVAKSPHQPTADAKKIVIPGYTNLYDFSQEHAALLQRECGGAWQSYFQHGHWRMIMPFSRHQQATMAELFVKDIDAGHPPVVHLVRFPSLKINHAVLLFRATEDTNEIHFATYDPNTPNQPAELTYDKKTRTFDLPSNKYFYGGRVDVYEVYRDWLY